MRAPALACLLRTSAQGLTMGCASASAGEETKRPFPKSTANGPMLSGQLFVMVTIGSVPLR